jgi:chromosome segregation ATPase
LETIFLKKMDQPKLDRNTAVATANPLPAEIDHLRQVLADRYEKVAEMHDQLVAMRDHARTLEDSLGGKADVADAMASLRSRIDRAETYAARKDESADRLRTQIIQGHSRIAELEDLLARRQKDSSEALEKLATQIRESQVREDERSRDLQEKLRTLSETALQREGELTQMGLELQRVRRQADELQLRLDDESRRREKTSATLQEQSRTVTNLANRLADEIRKNEAAHKRHFFGYMRSARGQR